LFGLSLGYRRNGTSSPAGFEARFRRNGVAEAGRCAVPAPVDGLGTLVLTAMLGLAAGDRVEVFARMSGADGYAAGAESQFWGHALG
ncbi:hypothetical protein Q0M01_14020, partial [Staphylococcus aureus]|nr:hypothetical protein [Staphylococcus aureus]